MATHLASQIQAGIGLIHRVAFWTREVNKMAAILEHFRPARLLPCFICQVCRSHCSAWCHRIATDIGINKADCHVLGQCVQGSFGGGVSSPTEGASAIDGGYIDDDPIVFR